MAEVKETVPVYVVGIGPATCEMDGAKTQVTVFRHVGGTVWSVITLLGEVRDVEAVKLSFASKSALNLANGTGAAAAMEKLHTERRELREQFPHLLDKRDIGRKADTEFMAKIRAKCESGEYKNPTAWTQKLGKDEDEVLYIGKLRNSEVWEKIEQLIKDDGYTFGEYVPEKRETETVD